MSPYVCAVYWLPPASSAFLLVRKFNLLAGKMLITCVMRHARLQKLQRLRREWPSMYSYSMMSYIKQLMNEVFVICISYVD